MNNKDRERWVAEMTKDLNEHVSYDEWSAREYGEYVVDCGYTAYKLVEQGWIKPDKDCVILTMEEYVNLKASMFDYGVEQGIETGKLLGNKETTKKILKQIREMLQDCDTVYEDDGYHISPDVGYLREDVDNGLNELEKQFIKED
jgi:hypothetical protein